MFRHVEIITMHGGLRPCHPFNLVQDGVERLHILAGSAAREHAKQQEDPIA